MASIEERTNSKGQVTSFRVIWRFDGVKRGQRFETRSDAQDWVELLRVARGDPEKATNALLKSTSKAPTLNDVAEAHIARLADVTPHTLHNYKQMLTNHIREPLGSIPVDQVTEQDIAEWVMGLREKGRSPKTIRNIHGLLHGIMGHAVRRRHRPDNPCEESRLPKSVRRDDALQFLTHAEFALLLSSLDQHFHSFALFLVSTGLRFSEATALGADDFTEHEGGEFSVRVSKAWKRATDGTRRYMGDPKSDKGFRTVGFGAGLARTIAPLVDAAAKDGGVVFRMKRGGALNSQSFNSKYWTPAVTKAQKAGLRKKPRVHDLRHTYASWMLADGTKLRDLADLMGHESVNTTSTVYSHFMPESRRAAAMASSASFDRIEASRPAELTA